MDWISLASDPKCLAIRYTCTLSCLLAILSDKLPTESEVVIVTNEIDHVSNDASYLLMSNGNKSSFLYNKVCSTVYYTIRFDPHLILII